MFPLSINIKIIFLAFVALKFRAIHSEISFSIIVALIGLNLFLKQKSHLGSKTNLSLILFNYIEVQIKYYDVIMVFICDRILENIYRELLKELKEL